MKKFFNEFKIFAMRGNVMDMAIGVVIGAVSCHQGFSTRLGAVGVGRATQRSVIISFLLILMLGYMVTRAFYIEFSL